MKRMKLKRVKKYKLKNIFILIITYFIFGYTFSFSLKSNNKNNQEFIRFLLNNGNANYISNYKLPKVINKSFNYIFKIDFTDPVTLFNNSIIDSGSDNNLDSELDKLKSISAYIENPFKDLDDDPLIYIYNTHQLENYNNYDLEIYGITPSVLMASYLLKEKLKEKGISSLVEDTNITEFLNLNKWSYGNSYRASRIFMLDKKNTHSSIKYYIDIHRDSVKKNISTIKINNKNYAKILFVIGLENKNYKKNLEFSEKLNNMFMKKYPGISRGILKKQGKNVDGVYNQDVSPYAILIEVGGQENNINEVLNTINAISDILSTYILENES